MSGKFLKEFKSVKDRVKYLLLKYPHLRDNDNKLVANYWFFELKDRGVNLSDISASELLNLFSNKKLSSFESISRCRRKLQEENEILRGKSYQKRKAEEDYTKKNINN